MNRTNSGARRARALAAALAAALACGFGSCASAQDAPAAKEPAAPGPAAADVSDLRALVVVPPSAFRDEEFAEVRKALDGAKIAFRTASRAPGKIRGMLGLEIEAALSLEDAIPEVGRSALVVFVGGAGTAEYFEDAKALELARTAFRRRRTVGAICLAPSLLARAGLLRGRRATVYASERETLAAAGAILVEEPVVREGRLVTADGPEAAPAFAAALVDLLRRDRASRLGAAQLLAGPRAQVDAGRHDEARAALLRIAEERRGDPHVAPWALAEAAYSFYLQKRFEEAAAAYARAAREYPASDAFGRAQACAADVLQRFLRKPREAAEAWRALIEGDCDDGEPTGNAASPYRNYRHRACLRLLEIHLERNEPAKALQAGLDALHRGFFVGHCPESLEEAQDEARAGAARAAAVLLGFRADEAMRETASGAAEADRYLLLLGKAYAAKGEASKAKKAFAALEFAFPGSAAAREIP